MEIASTTEGRMCRVGTHNQAKQGVLGMKSKILNLLALGLLAGRFSVNPRFAAVVFACLFPVLTWASVIVSTLPQVSTNTTGVGGINDYAAGFVWTSSNAFASAELYLGVEGDPSAPLRISLYDSVGGAPGSELLALSGPADILGDGLYMYSGSIALTQGATYWIVASTGIYGDHLNEYIWWDGTLGDANYVGTMFRRPIDPYLPVDWTVSGVVTPAAFRVNDSSSVPEPGTLALLGLGLAGLGLSRRRKA